MYVPDNERVMVSTCGDVLLKLVNGPQPYLPTWELPKDGMINGEGMLEVLEKGLPLPSA